MWAQRAFKGIARPVAIGAAVAAAFAAGVVVGVSGRGSDAAKPAVATTAAPDPVAQARAAIAADAVSAPKAADLDATAIKAMLTSLGDPWASYHPAGDEDSVTAALDGSYAGLGMWLREQADGGILISSVLPGSAASGAGIAPGDALVSVGSHGARGASLDTVVNELRGVAGSHIAITTRTTAGVVQTYTLKRGEVSDDDSTVQRLSGGIVLARIAAFSKGVATTLAKGLAAAKKAGPVQGIVLDLRGDPGGLLTEGVAVAGQFLNGGTVVTYTQRGQKPETLTAQPGGDSSTPLAVLVDGGTASAAEVVAGALQDRHRALLVGSSTFGKGSVQEPVHLSDGSTIEITVGTYATPSGRSLDKVGLTPDVAVKDTTAAGSAGDPVLAEAETVVGALLADAGTKSGSGRG